MRHLSLPFPYPSNITLSLPFQHNPLYLLHIPASYSNLLKTFFFKITESEIPFEFVNLFSGLWKHVYL